MSMLSNLLCAWFAFLIPCYSTWKALAHRPLSEPDLERWAMYWVCVGGLVAFENVAQWFVSWFPFYWEARTLFLLFLALPQTQGSTFIFQTYVEPFFKKNEGEIDAGIQAAQSNTLTFLQAKLMALWETLWRVATKSNAAASSQQYANGQGRQPPVGQSTAPSPASVLAMGTNLIQTYGGGAFGALQRQFGSSQAPSGSVAPGVRSDPSPKLSPGLQPRPPFYAASSSVSGASSRSQRSSYSSTTPPAFPEPHYH